MNVVLIVTIISFVVAWLAVLLVRHKLRKHSAGYDLNLPQRFHHGDVPRLGGLGMLAGWLAGLCVIMVAQLLGLGVGVNLSWQVFMGWACVILGGVAVGAWEDATQRVPVKLRLLTTALAGVVAVGVLGVSVPRLGFVALDAWWQVWPICGVVLAVFALAGLPHAFNIIDGYNGLAGTTAMIMGGALAYLSFKLGDRELVFFAVCMVAATAGFLLWNFPRGLVFAGDGGAYFWGLNIALLCILLVQRNPQVSPWFAVLLLIYPVWETLFSVYRKLARGQSPGMADALHLHQLVYRRLVRAVLHDDEARALLLRNNRTTPYLLSLTFLTVLPAMFFWDKTWVLIGFVVLFIFSYVGAYLTMVRFKLPRWLGR